MTFLAINSQRSLYARQKSQLEFEKSIIVSRIATLQEEAGYLAEQMQGSDMDYTSSPQYQQLHAAEMYYQTRQDNIDSQITFLNEALNSFKTLANNNMKSSGQLNLGSGS